MGEEGEEEQADSQISSLSLSCQTREKLHFPMSTLNPSLHLRFFLLHRSFLRLLLPFLLLLLLLPSSSPSFFIFLLRQSGSRWMKCKGERQRQREQGTQSEGGKKEGKPVSHQIAIASHSQGISEVRQTHPSSPCFFVSFVSSCFLCTNPRCFNTLDPPFR